jgi:L-ascorbate 6-phosphate lactonase
MDKLIQIKYLGQAGFVVRQGENSFVIDPYLSNYVVEGGIGSAELFSREFAPPILPSDITGLQVAFITHDHADHCDPLTILPLLEANPDMILVGPRPVAEHLKQIGIDPNRVVVPIVGEMQNIKSVEFYAVPAAHYGFDLSPEGEYAYFGYVIKLNERWLYHAGDTILYDNIVERTLLHTPSIDIACLPVNGRDAERERIGIIGNLDSAEALELAGKIKTDVLLPMHNDLFKVNHVNPAILTDLADNKAPRQKIHWLQPGEDFYYS